MSKKTENATATETAVKTETATAAQKALEMVHEAETAAVWEGPDRMPQSFATVSYAEYLELSIMTPVFQRTAVWTPKWKDGIEASVMGGKPFPALIVCRIIKEGKVVGLLLIDGVQRTTAWAAIMDSLDATDPDGAAKISYMESMPVNIMYVDVHTVMQAADLFILYNSGNRLTGVQKNRAGFSEAVNATLKEYDRLCKAAGLKNADTTAAIIAAAVACEDLPGMAYKAGSTCSLANKVLSACDTIPLPPESVHTALNAYSKMTAEDKAVYKANNRIVPLTVGIHRNYKVGNAVTADEVLQRVTGTDMASAKKVSYTVLSGKKTKTASVSIRTAMGDSYHSGSAKDTAARSAAYTAVVKGLTEAPKTATEEAAAMIEEALS